MPAMIDAFSAPQDPLAAIAERPPRASLRLRHPSSRRRWAVASALLAVVAVAAFYHYHSSAFRFACALRGIDEGQLELLPYELIGLKDDPRYEAQASLLTGKLLLAEGQPEAAVQELAAATTQPATRIRALVLLGEGLYKTKRSLDAGETWASVLQSDPDNIDAHRWLGVAYYDLGIGEMAKEHLQKAAALAPGDPRPLHLIGHICSENADLPGAADAYEEALRRDPHRADNDDIRFRLADVRHRLRDDRRALAVLAECAPTAEVIGMQAECHYGMGEVEQAQNLNEESLRRNPNLVRSLALKGKLLIDQREFGDAVHALEAAARRSPRDTAVLYDLILAYQRLGETEKVSHWKQVFDHATQLQVEYVELAAQAAQSPRDANMRYRLGILAARLDMAVVARSWLQAALRLEPNNAKIQGALNALKWPSAAELLR